MAAITQNTYIGDGFNTQYTFNFEYLNESDVKAKINDIETTEYSLINATTVQFNVAPPPDSVITIYRLTDTVSLPTTFYSGSTITAKGLNDNFEQTLYVSQEVQRDQEQAIASVDIANEALVTANEALTQSSAAQDAALSAASDAAQAQASADSAASDASDALSQVGQATSAALVAQQAAQDAQDAVDSIADDSSSAVNTANKAAQDAAQAASDAANADAKADQAITDSLTAINTANAAQTTADAADAKADIAITDSAAALAAVATVATYPPIANVAAIPASPSEGDGVRLLDSTGIESFTPLTGLPSGLVGDAELDIDILYSGGTWIYVSTTIPNPDARYVPIGAAVSEFANDVGYLVPNDNVSLLVNDAGYITSSTSDANYVRVLGDNMSGNLTLGDGVTDRITLDASTGAAEFDGYVSAEAQFQSNRTDGTTASFVALLNDEQKARINADGSALFGGTLPGDPGVSFTNSGSAKFAGSVTTGPIVVHRGNTAKTPILQTSGSGNVVIGDAAQVVISNDGSAEFAGNIISNGYINILDSSNSGYYMQGGGSADATDNYNNYIQTEPATGDLLLASKNLSSINTRDTDIKFITQTASQATTGASTTALTLASDGSALFAGAVTTNDYVAISGSSNSGYYLQGDGLGPSITNYNNFIQTEPATGDLRLVSQNLSNVNPRDTNIKFFTQTISQAGAGTSTNALTLTATGGGIFHGNVTAPNVTFNLEPDNDANYTTTTEEYTETESYTGPLGNTLEREVTRTRDVRTYTGPTLDVKDRLQNVLSRIDAIEANEVADDATDSALLQLVASLTTRLDEKDAAIASLTATLTALTDRVTTLES